MALSRFEKIFNTQFSEFLSRNRFVVNSEGEPFDIADLFTYKRDNYKLVVKYEKDVFVYKLEFEDISNSDVLKLIKTFEIRTRGMRYDRYEERIEVEGITDSYYFYLLHLAIDRGISFKNVKEIIKYVNGENEND